MGSIAILGAGGHGRVVADCAEAAGWTDISIFDDRPSFDFHSPWPVVGTGADLLARVAEFEGLVVGIGANPTRLNWHRQLSNAGARLMSVVHPHAMVSAHAQVGRGSVVFAGAVVNIGARLGEAVIINSGATVDHDCEIADGVHISPGAHLAGGVTVDELSWVGIGAAVREGVIIGRDVTIGAGAIVIKSVEAGLTMVGNPARPLEKRPYA